MSTADTEIVRHLPMLRRYARCLAGSQERGDLHVQNSLEVLLGDPARVARFESSRLGLYHVFHILWCRAAAEAPPPLVGAGAEKLEQHIRNLPPLEREVLLLTTLCEFTLDEVARILGVTEAAADSLLVEARRSLDAQTRTEVLIIEDEPVIAFDLAEIVGRMGHEVIGIADSAARAVELAHARRPGIVLADIQLRGARTGIDAIREIRAFANMPVIYVTAFPERLLTGKGAEPTYLITKPFDTDELRVTISQALLLHPDMPLFAAG